MILRVYRASADADDRGRLLAHLRDVVYPANVRTEGLRTFQAGIRELGDDLVELTIVSTWQSFGSLVDALGTDTLRPKWLDEVRDHVHPVEADHYELVGEELSGVVPLAGGALTVLKGRLERRAGESFFEVARRQQAEQLDGGEILISHIGRRLSDQGVDAVYVAVSADTKAPVALGGQWLACFDDWDVVSYEALARVPPITERPQALLLADDERRYIFATNAAARLLGYSSGRLLGQRIDDLVDPTLRERVETMWESFLREGSLSGPFSLRRLDGTTIDVAYEAHANTPWPGVHASVLAEPTAIIDFTEALGSAGVVARYELAMMTG